MFTLYISSVSMFPHRPFHVGSRILIPPQSDLIPTRLRTPNPSLVLVSDATCLLAFARLLCPAEPGSLYIVSFPLLVVIC